MEDHLWALHHHLAHSGYVHHEAVCQWSVRGYKLYSATASLLSPSLAFSNSNWGRWDQRHPMAMLQGDWDMSPDVHARICLFMETFSILEIANTCSRRKCCVRSGCLPQDAEASGVMSWQLPEIAYQLLGVQVRPPTLFRKKLFVQLLFSSELFANPQKSNS